MSQEISKIEYFLDEGAASPQSMEVSAALAGVLARAASVNDKKEAFAISFSSLFIGLLATSDATGEWLRSQFERSNTNLDKLLMRQGLDQKSLNKWIANPVAPKQSLPSRPLTRTESARKALDKAEKLANAASQLTDTKHVFAALISLPGFHDRDFEDLEIDRGAWAKAFEAWLNSTAGDLPQAPLDFDPKDSGVEPRVVKALKRSNALAGSTPIGPSHVAEAIVDMAKSMNSEAFNQFAKLVPLSAHPQPSLGEMPDAARLDENLRRQLARAQMPSPGSKDRSQVWGRDLATAALLCPDNAIEPTILKAGRSLDTVRDLWYVYVTSDSKHRPKTEWADWWRAADIPLPEPRRAVYSTETDQGDDKLGVKAEARGFARLILDKDVHAPLSIGLLGDWGSGKSFFIEQIKKGIKELKEECRPELYAEVVEIEFNAWHASDSNLWASLVTNIFDKIWESVAPAGKNSNPKRARERLQKQIEKARGAVHEVETQVQLGQQALELAERDLEHKREILAWDKYATSIASKSLQSLAKSAGWHQSIDTINDVEKAARTLAASGNRLRAILSALLEKPFLYIALPTVLLLVITGAAWLLVNESGLQDLTARVTKLLATVAAIAGALVVPLKIAARKVSGLAENLETIHSEYEKALDTELGKEGAGGEDVKSARRELASTEASVTAARARLGELLNEQALLDPQQRLGAFLHDRVQSTQYRSQQGIISLVHKDFSELSNYMKDLRESGPNKGEVPDKDAIRPFDRVVLYVDDLDRCRPAHVVNMLEAVHLLLALDLFVVIVAVDSRWLTRSLEVHYNDLLTASDEKDGDGMRASTPQSYLEKIFQITYALGPMDPDHFGNYVAFLAGQEGESKPHETTAPDSEGGVSPSKDGLKNSSPDVDQIAQEKTNVSSKQTGDESANDKTAIAKVRRPSMPVRIEKAEREFISRLVPLLPTPRIAKRLVNVYRVIKAGKSVGELDAFEREGRAETCLLMLAILFGRPVIASDLLRTLHERKPPFDKPDEQFIKALQRRGIPKDEPAGVRDSWDTLIAALETIGIEESVGNCAREPKEVARYSLVSGHDWHTWGNQPSPTEQSPEVPKATTKRPRISPPPK